MVLLALPGCAPTVDEAHPVVGSMTLDNSTHAFNDVIAIESLRSGDKLISIMASERAIDLESIKQRVDAYAHEGVGAWAWVDQPFVLFTFKNGEMFSCNFYLPGKTSNNFSPPLIQGALKVESGRAIGQAELDHDSKTTGHLSAQLHFSAEIVQLKPTP